MVNDSKQFMSSNASSPRPNRVLLADYRPSQNFFRSDQLLQAYLQKHISGEGAAEMQPALHSLGEQAAGEMNQLSLLADQNPPALIKRNHLGEDINQIRFHPAYHRLLEIAVESRMFNIKWEPETRRRFAAERHRLGFLSGYLYAMSESGQYCPLCMTDGVARLIDRYCTPQDRDRLLPRIATLNPAELYTGAMFLTEKAGGSDVGANLVKADQVEQTHYKLYGEKWFCSNANAELIFALARTREIPGTRGLGIFLVEKSRPDGSPNPLNIIRLKDKLGVRSMASAEILLEGTSGTLVGGETEGFKIMADMINLSRLYNSVAALSAARRAVAEAWQFLSHRISFGSVAKEHPLVRRKLLELGSLNVINFYFVWKAIQLLDAADNGDSDAAHLLRLLTPMVKKWSAETGVYVIREAMELHGGNGYIEDGVLPKLLRDACVLPIWEGAGNIMTLDMLRATHKSEGLQRMFSYIGAVAKAAQNSEQARAGKVLETELRNLQAHFSELTDAPRETMEYAAGPLFARLTNVYQLALLTEELDNENRAWVGPAIEWLAEHLEGDRNKIEVEAPPAGEIIAGLMAWEF